MIAKTRERRVFWPSVSGESGDWDARMRQENQVIMLGLLPLRISGFASLAFEYTPVLTQRAKRREAEFLGST